MDVEDVGLDEAAALDVEDFDAAVGGGTETKLFGKWSFSDIKVRDISLEVSDLFLSVPQNRLWGFTCCFAKCSCFMLNNFTTLTTRTGLYCLQGSTCRVLSPHGRKVPKTTIPQSQLPHCRAFGVLPDEKGS